MQRTLEHGKFRMLEVLKHPSRLGETLDKKDWVLLEELSFQQIKRIFYKNISDKEIKELEKIKFKLENWSG